MSQSDSPEGAVLVALGTEHPVWDRFFHASPLVVVGTREEDGSFDLAPKHMAMPVGWENWFGFVCTPRHATYGNAKREGVFTVSFPRPSQVLSASLASARLDVKGTSSRHWICCPRDRPRRSMVYCWKTHTCTSNVKRAGSSMISARTA